MKIVQSIKGSKTISTPFANLNELFSINPDYFAGDCESVISNLSKVVKTLVYQKSFEVAKNLLNWIIRLLNCIAEDRIISLVCFIWKVCVWMIKHIQTQNKEFATNYAKELGSTLNAVALANLKLDKAKQTFFWFSTMLMGDLKEYGKIVEAC